MRRPVNQYLSIHSNSNDTNDAVANIDIAANQEGKSQMERISESVFHPTKRLS